METFSKIREGKKVKASFHLVESLDHQDYLYDSHVIEIRPSTVNIYKKLIDLGYRIEVSLSKT